MEKEPKREYYEVIRQWESDGRKHRIVRMKATPNGSGTRFVEVEYEETEPEPGKPQGWQKVYGSEHDLGAAA